jgi:hypothetical protein
MAEVRDFKGVWIPKAVWLDSRLTALDKVILTEIDSLDQGERGCFASNKHIADFCQCSITKVSTSISKLIDMNYLYVQNYDGRQRELKSRLSNFERQTFKKYDSDSQKLKESNTYTNTPTNTRNKRQKPHRMKDFVPPTLEEVEAYCKSRNNHVDAKRFHDYFTASNWVDSKGNKVRNWKQKVITWESYNKEVKQDGQATGDSNKVRFGNII